MTSPIPPTPFPSRERGLKGGGLRPPPIGAYAPNPSYIYSTLKLWIVNYKWANLLNNSQNAQRFYKNAAQRHFWEQYIVKGAALKSLPKALPLETANTPRALPAGAFWKKLGKNFNCPLANLFVQFLKLLIYSIES